MRIIHIVNYFMPEMGYQEYHLAKWQSAMGHEVHILTSTLAYPRKKEYKVFDEFYSSRKLAPGQIKAPEGFTVHRLPIYAEFNTQVLMRGILSEIERIYPDVIFIHGLTNPHNFLLALWKKMKNKKTVLLVDDHTLFSSYQKTWYRRFYYLFTTFWLHKLKLINAFKFIIAVSAETKDFIETQFHLNPKQLKIIPLGVDCEIFRFSVEARKTIRDLLGISQDAIVIIYAGKIIPDKGPHLVYEASKDLLVKNQNSFLLFVGSGVNGDYANEIRNMAKTDGLFEKIIWHGHVSQTELSEWFSASDIAIWPLQETMASLQAAACGVPLVLRRSTVSSERVVAGNGFLCDSVEDMKRAIIHLSNSEALRASMGAKGVEFVKKHLDWKVIARSFIDLVNE